MKAIVKITESRKNDLTSKFSIHGFITPTSTGRTLEYHGCQLRLEVLKCRLLRVIQEWEKEAE